VNVRAVLLLFLLGSPALSQEFKPAAPIAKERYIYGMPVSVKKGSRFSKLNLVPGGWELWIVEANGARPFQFGDNDQPNPTILEKARACTRFHEALSAEGGGMDLTLVVRRPGNSKGILVRVAIEGWDAGFDYIWRKWRQDPKLIILPLASTQVGSESYTARVDYREKERLDEVAAYERKKREEADDRRLPGSPLKNRESFQIVQRQLMLDAGIEKATAADDAYFASRRLKSEECQRRGTDRLQKKEYFEAHRLLRLSAALSGDKSAGGGADSVKAAIAPLDAEDRNKLRTKALQEAMAASKESLADAAEGAAFCLFMNEGDKEAAKILQQSRKKAFGAKDMTKADLDRWIAILGPLADLPASSEPKEDGIYRVSGKVARAGPFTLVENAKSGTRFVFEDKASLKFDVGDFFMLVGVCDGGKPPAAMPEDLKAHPLLRLVVIR